MMSLVNAFKQFDANSRGDVAEQLSLNAFHYIWQAVYYVTYAIEFLRRLRLEAFPSFLPAHFSLHNSVNTYHDV
jgi:hypothetical protein